MTERRRQLSAAVDQRTTLSALAGSGAAQTHRAPAVLDPDLDLLRRMCGHVIAEAAPDEELRRGDRETLYLRRWWIRRPEADQPSSRALYLHAAIKPDGDSPHTHPWDSASLLVDGVLTDQQFAPDGAAGVTERRWRLWPGDVLYRPATHCHLLDPRGTTALTLFATGPRTQPWGFVRPDGTVGCAAVGPVWCTLRRSDGHGFVHPRT